MKSYKKSKSRKKLGKKHSKKLFTATASKTHFRNIFATRMRGGYRL